jgi:uncharacterized protein YaeQ
MALGATVFKVQLEVSDIDRAHYHSYALTLARHPSETDERMMVRLVAFVLNAHERLEFGGGLSNTDEPALWRKDLTGAIKLWIEVGQPDVRVLRKASARAAAVRLYIYGRGAEVWWSRTRGDLERFKALAVSHLTVRGDLPTLVDRNMRLHALVQDGQVHMTSDTSQLEIGVEYLLPARG